MKLLSDNAIKNPKKWFWFSGILSALLIALVALPSIWPSSFSFLSALHIDTDPENMLSPHEEVRVYHTKSRETFNLYDMVVVGVQNENNPNGVFNPKSLSNINELTEFAKSIQWTKDGKTHGVIGSEMIAPSMVDTISQSGLGSVRFEWLMKTAPHTQEEATAIAQKAKHMPFLDNTLISNDGKSLALYLPIAFKSDSYEVAEALRKKVDTFTNGDTYHITGLPIAQDQFGIEMFKQMAVSAPLAMLLIFVLLWLFFKNIKLIIAPMIVAMISVIMTMGLLIVTGNTVHIMSSMIPIFIMPIAVLDAVHILSDFFDRYPKTRDRLDTVKHVMSDLGKPMLFTSLTTCAGFASLAFTPIPPVQVFGIFIAIGVFLAWIFTVTLVPAYIMLLPEKSLENFGLKCDQDHGFLAKILQILGRFTFKYSKLILIATLLLSIGAYMGIRKININDNPVKWFEPAHPIRIADAAMNKAFAGTYMGYLVLESPKTSAPILDNKFLSQFGSDIQNSLKTYMGKQLKEVENIVIDLQDNASTDAQWDKWDKVLQAIDKQKQAQQTFKNPEVLRYVAKLQHYLLGTGLVGKSNGLPDVVKTVHRELMLGEDKQYIIPNSSEAVAQCLLTYEGSHRPQDLWHFVTPDYSQTLLWIQLRSGDNQDMKAVVDSVSQFVAQNPPPVALNTNWFGLNYINVVWQEKMVTGMMESFLGSFLIVLIMMIFLFRSFWWGLLSMVPLTVTIALIYGIIGLTGKDYDMPVAVLSSLSLGLAVDYAIHFIARSRDMVAQYGSWKATIPHLFAEPARAITRNVIVIGIGFTPLLAAPLVPYQTVGVFISSILLCAGGATLFLLPAIITELNKLLFKNQKESV